MSIRHQNQMDWNRLMMKFYYCANMYMNYSLKTYESLNKNKNIFNLEIIFFFNRQKMWPLHLNNLSL